MLEKEVLRHPIHKIERSWSEKAADIVSGFIGSWKFLTIFIIFLIFWMAENIFLFFFQNNWDPYPYIFLNLILAIITALTSPIILMSQNREAHRDRLIAEYDHAINQKSEREVREIKEQLNRIEKKLR